jgi:hypothetical protein
LHKRWPEVFLDAPHQLLPGKELTVWLLVKDADLYPIKIHSVQFQIWDDFGGTATQDFEPDRVCIGNLQHLSFPLPQLQSGNLRGLVRINGTITVERVKSKVGKGSKAVGETRTFVNHNLPGLISTPLEVLRLKSPLPYPPGWRAGEMHCHSEYSSDPVEFGAPLDLMQQTADAIGLDFVLCTDHSYDFHYCRDRFLEACDPHANFADYRAQAEALNQAHPERPTLVPGEEVSCGNSRGENVHLLTFGHPGFLPGLGDGGRRGLRNRPDLTVAETLELLGDTPAFAAHPKAHIGWLERQIFRRGQWREEDLAIGAARPVGGLQFWNGNLGPDYVDGKAFWIEQLLKGHNLLPIGANDAHGDFNRNTGVKLPLVSLKQGRSHVFGRVRTVVPSGDRDADALRAAFRGTGGNIKCLCTDGPFADLSPVVDSSEDGGFRVTAVSTPDYGTLHSVTVYGAARGETSERVLADWRFNTEEEGPLQIEQRLPAPFSSGYLRLEAITRTGRRAMTAAHFLG